jgi:hypothetical protein
MQGYKLKNEYWRLFIIVVLMLVLEWAARIIFNPPPIVFIPVIILSGLVPYCILYLLRK